MEALLQSLPPGASLAMLAVGAMLAAIVNPMAGGGSMLVLPLMLAVGLPPGVANGTLRVGVLVQTLSALVTFHRRDERPYGLVARLALPIVAGAGAGTFLATRLSDALLLPIIGVLLAGWAIVLLFRPGRFLAPDGEPRSASWKAYVGAFCVGTYGGFLQVGVGFPMLALMTLGLGLPVVRANAAKNVLVLAATLISLPIFASAGQIAWLEGGALAAGAMLGGWLGTRWQLKSGAGVVRWFVVVTATISGIGMLVRSFA
ncbi:MAG: sulfite exporter TauE/SafE family protein [Myxococcota bacterium]